MKKLTKNEALERLRNTCSRTEKCLFDIKKKLMEWKLSEEFDTISQSLIEENFINEERFVTSYVKDKIRFSKWGKQKVRYNLHMRNIDNQLINTAIEQYPQDDYLLIVKKELDKKNRSIKETDKYKRLQKLLAFAAQRGYEAEYVHDFANKSDSDTN